MKGRREKKGINPESEVTVKKEEKTEILDRRRSSPNFILKPFIVHASAKL